MNKPYRTVLISLVFFAFACSDPAGTGTENSDENSKTESAENVMPSESAFQFDLIIANNIAAPVKLLTDINEAGLNHYQEDITNPTKRVESYSSSEEKALGFGVYGADLSYNSLYQRNEEMAEYLIAIRKLSEDLGLTSLFDESSIEMFDRIKTNPDSVKLYIFDKYDQADEYLRSNDRLVTATLVLTGGLVESLHLVSHQIESGDVSKDAYMIFLEQKNTLKNLLELLNSLESEGQVVKIKSDIEMLYNKFKEVDSFDQFSKESIHELHIVVDEVRNKLV